MIKKRCFKHIAFLLLVLPSLVWGVRKKFAMKDGSSVQGEVLNETDSAYVVKTSSGELSVKKAEIAQEEPVKIKIRRSGDNNAKQTDLLEEDKSGTEVSASERTPAPKKPPVELGGYFRVMARDDFGIGAPTLGYWPVYGRLLNETPWLTLEMTNRLIQPTKTNDPLVNLVIRMEGGSLRNADPGFGSLDHYRFTQLYLYSENALYAHSVIVAGNLWYNMGYIGIYDMYVSQLFWETVGVRAGQKIHNKWDYFVGIGDSGYNILEERLSSNTDLNGAGYNSTPTVGALARFNLTKIPQTKKIFDWAHAFWTGLGGQFMWERSIEGAPNAPYQTPGITYEEYIRGEALQNYLLANPGKEDLFRGASPSKSNFYKLVAWIGFNLKRSFGPVKLLWWDISFSLVRKRPERSVTETYNGITKTIYITDFTDERYEFFLVSESQWQIWPKLLDVDLGLLYSSAWNNDNQIKPDSTNRRIFSAVLREQIYVTRIFHVLMEESYTMEKSTRGNAYREHYDSITTSTNDRPDNRGLEYGDTDTKHTLQFKIGPVLSFNGRGLNARPVIRLLYGIQYSNAHAAFANSFDPSLSTQNKFQYDRDRHWHHIISIEAEHWWGSY